MMSDDDAMSQSGGSAFMKMKVNGSRMGRKKIKIEKIQDTKNRQVTFNKRKVGLMKKAIELAVLCDCEVALLVFHGDKLFQYSSSPIDVIMQRYHTYEGNYETLDNTDLHNLRPGKASSIRVAKKKRTRSWSDSQSQQIPDDGSVMSDSVMDTPHPSAKHEADSSESPSGKSGFKRTRSNGFTLYKGSSMGSLTAVNADASSGSGTGSAGSGTSPSLTPLLQSSGTSAGISLPKPLNGGSFFLSRAISKQDPTLGIPTFGHHSHPELGQGSSLLIPPGSMVTGTSPTSMFASYLQTSPTTPNTASASYAHSSVAKQEPSSESRQFHQKQGSQDDADSAGVGGLPHFHLESHPSLSNIPSGERTESFGPRHDSFVNHMHGHFGGVPMGGDLSMGFLMADIAAGRSSSGGSGMYDYQHDGMFMGPSPSVPIFTRVSSMTDGGGSSGSGGSYMLPSSSGPSLGIRGLSGLHLFPSITGGGSSSLSPPKTTIISSESSGFVSRKGSISHAASPDYESKEHQHHH